MEVRQYLKMQKHFAGFGLFMSFVKKSTTTPAFYFNTLSFLSHMSTVRPHLDGVPLLSKSSDAVNELGEPGPCRCRLNCLRAAEGNYRSNSLDLTVHQMRLIMFAVIGLTGVYKGGSCTITGETIDSRRTVCG